MYRRAYAVPVSYIPFAFPGVPQVRCAFQTRSGGVSLGEFGGGNIAFTVQDKPEHVIANRRSMLEGLRQQGMTAWAELMQVHGDGFVFEPEAVACETPVTAEGDGMATARPGLGLLIKTADCQPILIAHKSGAYIAAMHAGWRGNRCDFPITGVGRFCERYGLEPRDLLAVRGPSLGPGKAEFVNFDKEWGDPYLPWFDASNKTMDLWGLTRHQLERAGLLPRNIYGLDICTASNNEQFFSYRCARRSGRQASLVWIAA